MIFVWLPGHIYENEFVDAVACIAVEDIVIGPFTDNEIIANRLIIKKMFYMEKVKKLRNWTTYGQQNTKNTGAFILT